MGVDIPAVRPQRHEPVGMFEPQVPCSRGAHRHAAEDDPIAVDAVATTDILDGLENIRLAGPGDCAGDGREKTELATPANTIAAMANHDPRR